MKRAFHYLLVSWQAIILTQIFTITPAQLIADEDTAQRVCQLKLDFLTKNDTRNKLPQIRNIAQELGKVASQGNSDASENKRFTLERELGVLTVLYLKDMRPEDREKLSKLALLCRDTVHKLPKDLANKWRQTDIYRIFLAA